MNTIHDAQVLSYTVDFEKQIIKMMVKNEQSARFQILFSNVLDFKFEDQLKNSILLDIEGEALEKFLLDNQEILQERKKYYWPLKYNEEEELLEYMKKRNLTCFYIQSSYGLYGWIVCEKYTVRNIDNSTDENSC